MESRKTAPFIGLRPFDEKDSHRFFGRRHQTEELLDRLHGTRMVAVVGSSGCGKSSLVRAGLVPALKAGFLVRSRSSWRVLVIKPGKAPIRHLAEAVLGTTLEESEEEVAALEDEIRIAGAEAILKDLTRHDNDKGDDGEKNVLLVVDQFEEIFRFGLHENNQRLREEAADFVSILLDLVEESTVSVYVVLTMRADFIRDCDDIPDLPEALNRSLFLVPRLTREQFREAIEGPVRWADTEISNRLLDRLLNDSSREHDELPVLQHALRQTWREWEKDGQGPVDSVHYERAGTAKRALDLDAEAALEGLSDEEIDCVRRLFQALTAMDGSNRKIRRPARLSELERITGLPGEEILALLGRFRSGERSLLVWSDTEPDPLIDISHESLIRNWERLSAWAGEEAESIALYRRLARAAADYPDRTDLWRDPKLQIALDWRESCGPTRTWAERVAPEADFQRTLRFLDLSLWAREEEKHRRVQERGEAHERKHLEDRRRLQRTRSFLVVATVAVLALVWLSFFAYDKKREAETLKSYYALTTAAWTSLRENPPQSLLLASAALSLDPPKDGPSSDAGELSSTERVFLRALAGSGGQTVASGLGSPTASAIAPDGRWLVTADGAKSLVCRRLSSSREPKAPESFAIHGTVTALAATEDRLLVATEKGEIRQHPARPGACPTEGPSISSVSDGRSAPSSPPRTAPGWASSAGSMIGAATSSSSG